MNPIARRIGHEFKSHAPFTMFGAATGIVIMAGMYFTRVPAGISHTLFDVFHPMHVLLSAMVTAGMYRRYGKGGLIPTILIGYFGSIGIATLSDCVIPFLGETLLRIHIHEMGHAHVRPGFIEKWWLVNPLALAGIALACWRPTTKLPHAAHVLLSTWASLFHMTGAMDGRFGVVVAVVVGVFLFLAVWLPCCLSDIVFPLLFSGKLSDKHEH